MTTPQRPRTVRGRAATPGLDPGAVLLLLAALGLMAVVAVRATTAPRGPVAAGPPAPGAAPAPADEAALATPDGPVTLAFGGDVHFESWLGDAVRADPQGALAPMAPLFQRADLAIVNLETAVTDRGEPAPKQYAFRAPPEAVPALRAAGVDVVSLANNHGMDFGVDGLRETLGTIADGGLVAVGAGMTAAEAYRPHRATVNGRRIAIFGATQVLDSFAVEAWRPTSTRPGLASAKDERGGARRLVRAVRQADRSHHTVVVVLHWGQEQRECPLERQQTLAAELRAAGADVIVGGHAHRVGPGGFMDDAVVHYGLGNLVFYTTSGAGTDSGVLEVTIAEDDAVAIDWSPAVLREGVATPLSGADRQTALATWEDLRSCTRLAATPGAG